MLQRCRQLVSVSFKLITGLVALSECCKLPQKQFDFKVDKMFNFKLVTDEKGTHSNKAKADQQQNLQSYFPLALKEKCN